MRILFFSHYFPPEVNAPANRTHEHCREWVKAGHEVHVVTCIPSHPLGKPFPGFRRRWYQHDEVDGIHVHRVWTYLAPNRGIARRTLNYLSFIPTAAWRALRLGPFDVAIGTSPQFFCAVATWTYTRLRRIPWGIVGPVLSIGLFAGALIVLATLLREVDANAVVAAFTAMPASVVALSILFTGLSYLALTGYDGLALRQIGAVGVPYSTAAIGSFTSYAISYTLGLPLLTAGTVRYRVYGGAGLSAPQIAALTLVCTLTFWLGMGAVLGLGLIIVPEAVSGVNHLPLILNMAIGAAILVAIVAYVVYVATKRRIVTVEGWSLPLPGGRVTVLQILLGVVDVCAGAAALYVLLPGEAPEPFFTFMVIYVLAAILGVASHAPGGIGVFEATMLVALPSIPHDQLLGSILLFSHHLKVCAFTCLVVNVRLVV